MGEHVADLGDLLRQRQLSQRRVAAVLGVDESIVGLWVRGQRPVPAARLQPLAILLGLGLTELQGGLHTTGARLCTECERPMRHVKTRTRCHSCILREHHRNGVFRMAVARRADRWTPEEEDQLRAMAGKLGAGEIAQRLGCRTRDAVNNRAHLLGVYIQTEDWTQHRVCRLFGAWEGTVAQAWFQSGLIRAYRLPPGRGCRQGEWRVKEADLEAFILDCPWAYEAARMFPQQHRLAQLAARVQRRDPWVTVGEVAAYIGCSRTAVVRWCHAGVIPFKRRHVSGKRGGRGGCMVIRGADLPAARELVERRQREARAFIKNNLQAVMRARRMAA